MTTVPAGCWLAGQLKLEGFVVSLDTSVPLPFFHPVYLTTPSFHATDLQPHIPSPPPKCGAFRSMQHCNAVQLVALWEPTAAWLMQRTSLWFVIPPSYCTSQPAA